MDQETNGEGMGLRPGPWARTLAGIGLTVGVAVSAGLIAWTGWHGIGRLLARAGMGLLWLIPLRVATIGLDTRGWRRLLPARAPVPGPVLLGLGMIRDAINTLLPVARVGGEMVAVRFLRRRGMAASAASASVIVETTVTLVLQVLATMAGIMALLPDIGAGHLVPRMLVGLAVGIGAVAGFVAVQLRGGLSRCLTRGAEILAGAAGASFCGLDRRLRLLYRQKGALAACGFWQGLSFVASAGEILVVARLMGIRLGYGHALIWESLLQAVHSLSFVIPGALGVQEGGFVMLGQALGVPPDAALGLALARRFRQVAFGLPVLISWRLLERRRVAAGLAVPLVGG